MKQISITIKSTDACNMRCRHCYHAEVGFNQNSLNIESAKKIIDIASKDYSNINVLYMGGEPTLWGLKNFNSFLDHQKKLQKQNLTKFTNTIQTNGITLKEDFINLFKENNFKVGVSFDGPHNDDLRTNGEEVLENIINAKKKGLYLSLICVETAYSIKRLQDTYNWFKKNSIDFKILPLFISGNAKKHKELELDPDDYVKNMLNVYKYWVYDKNCNIKIFTFESLLQMSDNMDCIHRGASCIFNRVAIYPEGNIYPCGRPYTEEFNMGYIDDFDSIADMLKKKKYQNLADIYNKRILNCKDCEVFSSCKGGCISDAILEDSPIENGNPYCIKVKKLLKSLKNINKEIYELYDNNKLENINPKAIEIIKKVRNKLL